MAKYITFILPGSSGAPAGGPRIVYEYANRLARRGYGVTVVHSPITRIDPDMKMLGKALIRYPQRLIDRSFRPDAWLDVEPSVCIRWTPTLHERFIPDADIVIATAWKTAEWVARYPARKGKKFYFIQHFEDWDSPADRVRATWKLPLCKIVIAKWLQDIAAEMGAQAAIVPNAIDTDRFCCDVPIGQRKSSQVAMLYHNHAWKGSADGLAALRIVKQRIPDLTVELFGVPVQPQGLPGWIQYHRNPPQQKLREIYNRAAIYLAPSWAEGWGLTAMEAAACGAALVLTDIGGFCEFAEHEVNALLSPIKEPEALAGNVIRMIEDADLRMELATAGTAKIAKFNWNRSVDLFETALLQL